MQELNLSGNHIRSLKGLEDHSLLENIDLEGNEVRHEKLMTNLWKDIQPKLTPI